MAISKIFPEKAELDPVREKALVLLKQEQRRCWRTNLWRLSERELDCDRAVRASTDYVRVIFDDCAERVFKRCITYKDFKAELARIQGEITTELADAWDRAVPGSLDKEDLKASCFP